MLRSLSVGLLISVDYWWTSNVALRGLDEVNFTSLNSPECLSYEKTFTFVIFQSDLYLLLWMIMSYFVLSCQSSPSYMAQMSACHQRAADNMVEGAIRNGGIYIKLGQGLCSFNHLLPPEYIHTLQILEDKALNRKYKEVSTAPQTQPRRNRTMCRPSGLCLSLPTG